MSNNKRILHERGFSMKYKQALKAIENCVMTWAEPGVSVRDLTLAESIKARAQQVKDREPLPMAEIYGLKYEPVAGAESKYRESRLLAYEAYQFTASETTAA